MKTYKKIEKSLVQLMNQLAAIAGKPQVFLAALLLTASWFIVGLFLEYDT